MAKKSKQKAAAPEAPEVEAEEGHEEETETDLQLEAEVPPEGPSMDELYARATELKVRGRAKMSRDELVAAIAAEEQKPLAPEVDDPNGELPEKDERQATPEQAQKIFAARSEMLEGLVADPDAPQYLRTLAAKVLKERGERDQQAATLKAAQGPMTRYKVTKGGRYIRDGFISELPVGSLLTPTTHDLQDVAKQGIEFEPATLVVVRHDEMGRQLTEIR